MKKLIAFTLRLKTKDAALICILRNCGRIRNFVRVRLKYGRLISLHFVFTLLGFSVKALAWTMMTVRFLKYMLTPSCDWKPLEYRDMIGIRECFARDQDLLAVI